ncbi:MULTISPECIES: peptidoglycan hydrolase RipC [unclassified Mycolicibacterium]|uniref:peptidoglycan hydrolase RipC n=1 Tax=unclassified Mycolicibacterium TaxID=2636767 RepID=UPI0012DC1423|nr:MULTISPECIES: peptidoglycan hydrolase RipC [unclassified Mycolicibacterium]MUL82403.1 endopeptidase [Mycolicibacterium sp. CBMA 329]MUL91465.1 endopeptidase [Mycolicibacterium sp. CBMA 331]MUM02943.1 endopeptidase [Mycolicibacterium sp. CBMA 334]MUM25954.1 endopeptidase [Mycolicibacterium sp. CBMA 295]MUM41889.1 endopeptidase [Mycolicibacterium sp. CBMA 247]
MRHDRAHRPTSRVKRPIAGAIAGLALISGFLAANSHADPADDAMAKLNELSRQAEQTTEAMHSAQLDLNNKLVAQETAEKKHSDDTAAVDEAKSQLATFQTSVNKVAAAQYMGGRTSGVDAILTAGSPQQLIEQLAVQRVMATEMSAQMKNFRSVGEKAASAEQESAQSAAEAKTAAEQAAAVRADLQSKQSQLQVQIAIVKSQYQALTPAQREAMTALPPAPPVPAPDALPPAQDPAVLADPPNGIPPGDVAPPEAGLPDGGGGHSGTVIQAALSRIGSPYSWGAAGPSSFDCSGLVMWAFQHAGISLPHSSQAMARGGQPVSSDSMQPGDVVTYYSDASHVGIYIGDGMMVHASTYGTPVRVAPVNNAPIYNVRRY